jgi:hypothetical protein
MVMDNDAVKVPRIATLDGFAEFVDGRGGIFIKDMPVGAMLEVQTQNSVYVVVIDSVSGEVLIRGGKYLPKLVPCVYYGAVFPGGLNIKVGWIVIGMSMNFKKPQDIPPETTTTSPVRSIRLIEAETKTVH